MILKQKKSFFWLFTYFLFILSLSAQAGSILHLRSGRIQLGAPGSADTIPALEKSRAEYSRIFQFKSQITPDDRKILESQGLRIARYLPEDAYVVLGSAQQLSQSSLILSARLQGESPVRPEWKIGKEILRTEQVDRSTLWIVSLYPKASVASAVESIKVIPDLTALPIASEDLAVRGSWAAIQRVTSIPEVEWVQPVPSFVTFMLALDGSTPAPSPVPPALTGFESGTRIMGFEKAWERGFHGEGQILAMADTGVDTGVLSTLHRDLLGQVTQGYAMGIGSKAWNDPQGHGTHVCGSVIGNGTVSDGAIRGGAYQAKMIASGLWSPIMNNISFPTNFDYLMGTPFKEGARVHTNSWGNPANLGIYDTFAMRVDEVMWNYPELLIIFAAGNSGQDLNLDGRIDEGSVSSPGTAKNVLTVGASENYLLEGGNQKKLKDLREGDKKWGVPPLADDILSNNPDGLAAFSSRGPTRDGRLKPEIVAPGTNIVSTRASDPATSTLWGPYNDHYVYAGGTSMATPLTAGAAGVARQYLVQSRRLATPSAALVKAVLLHTAKDLYPGQYGLGPKQEIPVKRPNVHEGYGRVDMELLTRLAQETQMFDSKAGVGSGESIELTSIQLERGQKIRATLSYTDAPASPGAEAALVNNIDLELEEVASGKVSSLRDSVNNSEMLELSGLAPGQYRLRVVGKNVPQGKNGKQPFAVIVSQLD